MKRTLCVLFIALLLCSFARACEEYTEVNFDYEATMYANNFHAFPDLGIQICVPSMLEPVYLDPADTQYGIHAVFYHDDLNLMYVGQTYELDSWYEPITDPLAYYYAKVDSGWALSEPELLLLNGMRAVFYYDQEYDEFSVVLANEGYVTTIGFSNIRLDVEYSDIMYEILPGIMPYRD